MTMNMKQPPIHEIMRQTDNRFLNMYALRTEDKTGKPFNYLMASRHEDKQDLHINTHAVKPDAVIGAGVCAGKLVLIRQFRYPLGEFIYELPAGLMEPNESPESACIREFFEETGLTFTPCQKQLYRPAFNSAGITDECGMTIFGTCTGTVSDKNLEDSETIQVVLADKETCLHILKCENTSVRCQFIIMMYLMGCLDTLN